MTSTHETTLTKSFQDLEKEALKEISLEIIRGDLLKSLTDHIQSCVLTWNNPVVKKLKKAFRNNSRNSFKVLSHHTKSTCLKLFHLTSNAPKLI